MIMCVLLCYPVSIHMSRLQATGRPISSLDLHKKHHKKHHPKNIWGIKKPTATELIIL